MTPESFAAWLRGFMDAIDGVPTPTQVERIRTELTKVQAAPEPAQVPATTPMPFDWRDWQKYVQPVVPQYPVYPEPWVPQYPSPTVPSIGWPWIGGGGTWCGAPIGGTCCGGLTYADAPGLTSGVQ